MDLVTNKQKADKLREAIALLQDADACIQAALGATDVCYETHNRLEDIVEDLRCDVQEFDNAD